MFLAALAPRGSRTTVNTPSLIAFALRGTFHARLHTGIVIALNIARSRNPASTAMAAHPVFASYAQADRDRKEHLEKFVEEFQDELGGLLGENDRTAVVFFDRKDVQAGDPWNETIIDALRHAKVLVCLMSPTYLGRPWCGRELEMFLKRLGQLPAGANARFIFPIWWQMPVTARPLPARLAKWHHRDNGFAPDYEKLGVKGLARAARWKQFRQMVDRLAQLVAETLSGPQHLPSGPAIVDIQEIANAFDEQQELDVRLLALTTGGDAWQPGPTDVTIAEAAERAARQLHIFIRPVETGAGIKAGLIKAQHERQVLLLAVDSNPASDAALKEIDALQLPNLAVLFLESGTAPGAANAWLNRFQAGAIAQCKAAGLMRVAGPGALAAEMQLLIDEARRRLRAGQQAVAAEDPALAAKAREQGIEIGIQPHLSGPSTATTPI